MSIENLNEKIDEVKGYVSNNLGKIIDRGENIDKIKSHSDQISKRADEFRVRAAKVRSEMEARRKRQKYIIIGVFVFT